MLDNPSTEDLMSVDTSSVGLSDDDLTEARDKGTKAVMLWVKRKVMSLRKPAGKKYLKLYSLNPLAENEEEKQTELNMQYFSVSKTLIKSPQTTAIVSHDAKIRRFLLSASVPPFNKKSMYMIALGNAFEVRDELESLIQQRNALVEVLLANYDEIINGMKEKLGGAFNYNDYPSKDIIRKKYSFEYKFFSWQAPITLRDVNLALYDKEQAKLVASYDTMKQDVRNALSVSLNSLIKNLINELSGKKDGTKKKFSSITIRKMTDFLDTFASKNSVFSDNELGNTVEKAKMLIMGYDVDQMKNDADVQNQLISGFEKIQTELAGLAENTVERAYELDDDE